jgi:hypothetical protein
VVTRMRSCRTFKDFFLARPAVSTPKNRTVWN